MGSTPLCVFIKDPSKAISDEILLLTEGQAQQHRGRIIVRGDDACAQNGAGESISCTSGAGTGKCGGEHFKSFHRVSKAEVSHRGF